MVLKAWGRHCPLPTFLLPQGRKLLSRAGMVVQGLCGAQACCRVLPEAQTVCEAGPQPQNHSDPEIPDHTGSEIPDHTGLSLCLSASVYSCLSLSSCLPTKSLDFIGFPTARCFFIAAWRQPQSELKFLCPGAILV